MEKSTSHNTSPSSNRRAHTSGRQLLKNIIHAIASVTFITWIIAVALYDPGAQIHYFLAIALAAALTRFLLERRSKAKSIKASQ